MKRPIVVAICGLDGSGKSTQVKFLTSHLKNQGYKAEFSKVNPLIGTDVLLKLSEKLFGDPYDYHPGIPPTILNSVLACDFTRHYLNVLGTSNELDYLICDRHKLCYIVYPEAYGSEMKWIENILSLIPDPDITIYLDTSVDVCTSRLLNRTEEPVRKDENPELLTEVKSRYLRRISENNNIYCINGNEEPEVIINTILKIVHELGHPNIDIQHSSELV
jgi:dTMP kinase